MNEQFRYATLAIDHNVRCDWEVHSWQKTRLMMS